MNILEILYILYIPYISQYISRPGRKLDMRCHVISTGENTTSPSVGRGSSGAEIRAQRGSHAGGPTGGDWNMAGLFSILIGNGIIIPTY